MLVEIYNNQCCCKLVIVLSPLQYIFFFFPSASQFVHKDGLFQNRQQNPSEVTKCIHIMKDMSVHLVLPMVTISLSLSSSVVVISLPLSLPILFVSNILFILFLTKTNIIQTSRNKKKKALTQNCEKKFQQFYLVTCFCLGVNNCADTN